MNKTLAAVTCILLASSVGLTAASALSDGATAAMEPGIPAVSAVDPGATDTVVQRSPALPQRAAERYWPQWRGPLASGVAPHGDPPTEWSEDRNVRWKVPIPGKGSASPIVWDDRIFVLTAVPATDAQQFTIVAINREDGSVLWQRIAREELPHEGTHPTGTYASPSAVTDGERVIAFFGSRGLYCYDMDGNLLWERDLGDLRIRLGFGEGASSALHGDRVVINWDHEGQSFIVVALDTRTGEEIWRTERDEMTSWTTPLIVEHAGGAQVVTSATQGVRSYDLETGELLWPDEGVTLNPIPSPVAADGLVFVTSGFRGSALRAIRLADASGYIRDSEAIVWRHDRDTPYVPSPLLYDGQIYVLKSNSGILTSLDARTGENFFGPQRLRGIGNTYASPVGAAGRIYIIDREGNALVLRRGPEFEVLARNSLDDGFDASPAIVDGEIYLRGRSYLYRISSD